MSKKAAVDWQGNSDLLQAVFDSVPNGIAVMQNIYDKTGKVKDFFILLFNRYALKWIGDSEYKGRRYSDVLPMVKLRGIPEKFVAVAETGITANFESWYDGEGIMHWVRFTAVKQDELLIVTSEDITTAKNAEDTLRESEKFNRNTLESSPDCLKVLDAQGRITYMNYNGTCSMEIDDFSTVRNKCWWDLWPDDSKDVVKISVAKALQGETAQFQAFCPTAKGSPRWWDVMVSPVASTNGFISQLISVSRDVTEKRKVEQNLKESEARFRTMIEQAPVAIGLTRGEDFIFESINAPMLKIIHQQSKADVLGKKMIEDVLTEMKNQPIGDMLRKVLQTGETFRGIEVPVPLTLDDVLYNGYYNISYSRIIEPDGTPSIMHMAIDVTEQVLARQRVEESESRFRYLIEEAPVAMALYTGEELKIELINETMVGYMGKGRSIIGKSLAQAIPELEGQAFVLNFQNVFRTGQTFHITSAPAELTVDGLTRQFYFDYTAKALRDANGEIYGVLNMGVDVTEQVISRKRLEESEQRFQNLVRDTTAAIVVLTGPEMTTEIVNEAFGKLIGRTPEELLHKPLFSVIPETELYYRPICEKVRQTGEPVYLYDSPYTVVADGKTINGFLHLTYQAYRDQEGNLLGVMILCQDVTIQAEARKRIEESESRFRLLANEMPQFVWTGDAAGNLNYFNQAVYEYSGLSVEEVATGGWIQIVHPEERNANIRHWQHCIATGQEFIFEHRFKRADGLYRWQLSRAVPQKDAQGVIQQWIGTSTDIQEQKNNEEQLETLVKERTKELQRSNEDLQQFAHVASHDLKEPIRKVKTFLGRLETHLHGKMDETAIRFTERIHSAANRMFIMIDGVLAYSTINASTQLPQPVDLNEVVKNILSDLEVIIQQTGTQIHYSRLPTVEGAGVLLYQLFYNLINNAIKFAKADVTSEIIISSEMVMDNKRQFARLTISDNGIGFEESQEKIIFDTYTRLNSKDRFEGTGLGLALCKKIVERHGGSISAHGIPGNGANFTVLLPVKQTELSI